MRTNAACVVLAVSILWGGTTQAQQQPGLWGRIVDKVQRVQRGFALWRSEQRLGRELSQLERGSRRFRENEVRSFHGAQLKQLAGGQPLREVQYWVAGGEDRPDAPLVKGTQVQNAGRHYNHVSQAAFDLHQRANRGQGEVYYYVFNGVPLVARKGDSMSTIVKRWEQQGAQQPAFAQRERMHQLYSEIQNLRETRELVLRPSILSDKQLSSGVAIDRALERKARGAGYKSADLYAVYNLRGEREIKAFVQRYYQRAGDQAVDNLAFAVGGGMDIDGGGRVVTGSEAHWRAAIMNLPSGAAALAHPPALFDGGSRELLQSGKRAEIAGARMGNARRSAAKGKPDLAQQQYREARVNGLVALQLRAQGLRAEVGREKLLGRTAKASALEELASRIDQRAAYLQRRVDLPLPKSFTAR